ncbi:MAG: comM protein [Phenylobacterium sp.]|nr:comM protein [Phenylobacterium sp.]
MAARAVTVAFQGVEARRVEVEVQFTRGEPKFILGLGDKAVTESRERVWAAFAGLGLGLPSRRIIANLAPAELPKEGSHYDLPSALAVMAGMGVIPPDALADWAAMGELSLDGRVVQVSGDLPAAVAAGAMGLGLICPPGSGKSMMAARLPGLLPPLTAEELLETSMIHSVAGLIAKGQLTRARPFRSPYHSTPCPPRRQAAETAARVGRARVLQVARAASDGSGAAALNAQADGDFLDRIADLDALARALLPRAAETGGLTARGWTRTLRLAHTIADLEGSDTVRRVHIAEALIYRRVSPAAAAGAPLMAG